MPHRYIVWGINNNFPGDLNIQQDAITLAFELSLFLMLLSVSTPMIKRVFSSLSYIFQASDSIQIKEDSSSSILDHMSNDSGLMYRILLRYRLQTRSAERSCFKPVS